MKTISAVFAKFDQSVLHDLRRDWEAWSRWEQRAATTLAVSTSLFGVFWLAMTLKLLG